MNKNILIGICIGLLMACQPEAQHPVQVGQLSAVSNHSAYLDVAKISTVGDFNRTYQEKSRNDESFTFLLPYNFDKKEIEVSDEAQTGIPIIGISYDCVIHCCKYSDLIIEVASDQRHQIESEAINNESLKKWMRLQILNYGQDPTLSDHPNDAVFRLAFEQAQALSDANLLLYQIIAVYEEFLQERATIESLDIKQTKEKYPLNLRFTAKATPMPTFLDIDEEEFAEEIILDIN
ncbi:hypothetical protein WJR50_23890 [Catalinimonas sp. 4WD22]|uniref:hypothetical protein n=1 Tax=Catalinimonas locisalis TaxID=3133978 RepID=UPI003101838A